MSLACVAGVHCEVVNTRQYICNGQRSQKCLGHRCEQKTIQRSWMNKKMYRFSISFQVLFRVCPLLFALLFTGNFTLTAGSTFTQSSNKIRLVSGRRQQGAFSRSRSHSLGYGLHSSKWPPKNFPLANKEAFIVTNQDGLTLDKCDPTEPCIGDRNCLAVNNDNKPCSGTFLCLCFPKNLTYCTASGQCQGGEICADTVFDVRQFCTSRGAVKSFSFLREADKSQSRPSPGLTLDACGSETVCKGDRTCTFIGQNPEFSDCDGRDQCFCLLPEPPVCFLSSDCDAGELCADTPLSEPPQCVSKKASDRHISISEVVRPEKSRGFTLDPCDTNTDCKANRKCFRFENDKPVPCQGLKACVCLPLMFENCKSTSECTSKNEICASTPFNKTPICTSMEARDAYEAVDQVLGPDVCPVKIQQDKPNQQLRLFSQRILERRHSRWEPWPFEKNGDAFLRYIKLETSQKIVGGLFSSENIMLYMAAILNPKFTSLCSGVLISPRWLLTAAHCGTESGYQVLLGRRLLTVQGGEFFTVTRAFRHPKYKANSSTRLYDIAVVEIEGGSLRDSNFMKVNADIRAPVVGSFVRAIGYGKISFNDVLKDKNPLALRQVDVPVISRDECNEAYSGIINPTTISRTGHLCFGSPRDRCGIWYVNSRNFECLLY